jgi:hypothetical protein
LRNFLLFLALITAFALPTSAADYAIPKNKAADAFDIKFKKLKLKNSCGKHPGTHSLKKTRGMHIFTMHHGDIGNCSTDKDQGKSSVWIPYSERAEIWSQFLKQGNRYIFKADISMDPNFKTAPTTTIFQVHQWVTPSCECGPYVMIFFDKNGHLYARILREHHKHNTRRLGKFTRKDFEGKWQEIAVDINTDKKTPSVSIYVGGKLAHQEHVLVQDGGAVFFKTGLYRFGRKSPKLPSDRMYVKDIGYAKVK